MVGVVNLVVLARVLRATTKEVVNFFGEEKCTPEKILATPMDDDDDDNDDDDDVVAQTGHFPPSAAAPAGNA